MFKHTVKYNDYNGNDREEDLYFHLATHEVTRIEAELGMSLEQHIKELTTNQKVPELLAFLERVMLGAYGIKSTDGKTFRKTQQIREDFEYSEAYAEFFEQVVTNPELAEKFGQGIADKGKKKNQVEPKLVAQPEPLKEQ